MSGDCSTCNHSVAASCHQGNEGREFLHSSKPLPCPVWELAGEKREIARKEWEARNPWPFPIQEAA